MLIFKVELVQIENRKAGEKNDPELLKFAQGYKDEGNGHFKEGRNQQAVQVYMNGVEHIEKIREPTRAPTPTARSSSSASDRHRISTQNIPSSEESSRDTTSLTRLRRIQLTVATNQSRVSPLLTAES